jgi:pSer/pThr/pTyr-binding forkhead associated (FHA) protein
VVTESGPAVGYRLKGRSDDREIVVLLRPGEQTLGSGRLADHALRAAEVSRRHAVVHVIDGNVTVEDLDSRNGTWVNGVRVSRGEIVPGDWLQLA